MSVPLSYSVDFWLIYGSATIVECSLAQDLCSRYSCFVIMGEGLRRQSYPKITIAQRIVAVNAAVRAFEALETPLVAELSGLVGASLDDVKATLRIPPEV
ncbi:hypothetical protein L1987_57302 [Smallanthus sonchifolius]|uniref:Uncharacterized protein n=1 Tax=Smallanthus sonchifolius TaxID=185202 RepID=A0ACB9DCE7_9ASTR|nr:hypothetical protein L1987_57302 [Smallanthus sonchifolius]